MLFALQIKIRHRIKSFHRSGEHVYVMTREGISVPDQVVLVLTFVCIRELKKLLIIPACDAARKLPPLQDRCHYVCHSLVHFCKRKYVILIDKVQTRGITVADADRFFLGKKLADLRTAQYIHIAHGKVLEIIRILTAQPLETVWSHENNCVECGGGG